MTAHLLKAKENRKYLDIQLEINTWENIAHYFNELENRDITSIEELEKWLFDKSELEAALEEEVAWKYIKMSCDTQNQAYNESYKNFVENIDPHIKQASNKLDKKLANCKFYDQLPESYFILKRALNKRLELFREDNIPVFSKLQLEEQKYGQISGLMTIDYDGKEQTLQQAANYLKKINREVREEVYRLIQKRRSEDGTKLNELLDELIKLRHKAAKNCGFKNYRDYKFEELERFDYSVDDVITFHNSIKEISVPILNKLDEQKKKKLKLSKLRPWDLDVDEELKEPLTPFITTKELIEKTITCFEEIDREFASFISIMDREGYLDLDSRKGKAPGGFNYPLYESNIPFIYMNATNNLRDLETMVHEGGHAIHSFLSKDIKLVQYKSLASEIAELASMSMELISMEHWDVFFNSKEELIRAKKSQIEGVLRVLPWIATIDKFQHWLYTNPQHTYEQRHQAWISTFDEFSSSITDYSGLEEYKKLIWQKQLHIYQVPFYYIEYGIAQLGAIAMWKQYKESPKQAISNYKKALSLGYSVSIPEIYKCAGIKFSFNKDYINELMKFVWNEYNSL